ncbi:hypothetical protein [Singulisphaera sp. PoT]|uniref:hypothetical protein n=1 Tax=Singulisphaera sp. PoT TaxID=3411797 RepID=UPI003BF46FB9
MSQANVRSLDSIKDFKTALINFSEDAKNALGSVDMEIRHFRNWLERDQLAYWKSQVKKSQEMLAQAKADLFRRQLSQANSESVSDADQKEAVRLAKKKLLEAEQKVEKIKKLVPVLEHAISEYHSQSQPLGDSLSGSVVGSIILLERMITAVERYLALEAPAAPVLKSGEGNSGPAGSGGSGAKPASAANGTAAEAAPANGEAVQPAANGESAAVSAEGTTTPPAQTEAVAARTS